MKEKIQMAIVMKTVKVRTPLTIMVMKIEMLSGRKDSKKGKNIASYEVRLGRLRIDICNKCYLNSYIFNFLTSSIVRFNDIMGF